jgi:aspartyl-tRNA synthetase
MGFADERSVMGFVEDIIVSLWDKMLNVSLSAPFPHISYNEAMSRYGSDKPDVRLGMEVRMPPATRTLLTLPRLATQLHILWETD